MINKLVLLLLLLTLPVTGLFTNGNAVMTRSSDIRSEVTKGLELPISGNGNKEERTGISVNHTIELKNPTFQEVKDFVLSDNTSQKRYVDGKYECRHFAADVTNNAETNGIRCAFVLLCYRDYQHAVVGFETVDRGMVYIEPQTDAAIDPVAGGKYQDQEITEILVIW